MQEVDFDGLAEPVQNAIAKLQIEMADLQFELHFYRAATLIAFILGGERVWRWFS